ncbi:hypothetical protein VOI54_10240 [Tamlana sp. 2201CG12-4]|uniref:hypothetical protein n=1 Tax=Tamlana sp. 2201CG12-4 TaxID=3112582 RepID=UPI002DB7E8B4|nr:hypothetical protein [Tamlana sp. 2201CG12-4]MEC3907398.1 hypothetical protein [Tamlana sp. 2201CG12-4]
MNNKIIYQGKKSYKHTKDYRKRKQEIIKKVNNKYNDLITNEKHLLKKVILIINKKNELKKELEILNSEDILFIKVIDR